MVTNVRKQRNQLKSQSQVNIDIFSDADQIQGLINTKIIDMDYQQESEIVSVRGDREGYRSNIQNNFKNIYRKQKESSYPSSSIASIIVIASLVILIFIGIKVASNKFDKMDESIARLESSLGSSNHNNQDKLKTTVESLTKRVKSLQSKLSQLSNKPKQSNPKTQTKLSTNSQASDELTPYFQRQFQSHKVTINFLHQHERESFYYQKVDFLKSSSNSGFLQGWPKAKDSFLLAINNFKIPHFNVNIQRERKELADKEVNRLSKEYDFNLPELPFCIVVATVNNARNFRYQYNMQSMVNLNYKNFKIVIIDDASTDHTYELIQQWINENQITHDIRLVRNENRMTAVPNINTAVMKHCDEEDIVLLVDGDDELLGTSPLKVFNHIYQKSKVDMVWSNHLQFYNHIKQVYRGWSYNYTDEEKRNNRYRDVPQKISHLRSFKAKLYRMIKQEDLKDKDGNWFTSTYDEVICLPILELTCGRNYYVEEFFYLYNFGIGTNDLQVDKELQKSIADEVKFKRKKYTCPDKK